MKHDPVERTPAYRAVVAEAEELAWRSLEARGFVRQSFGSCHWFWPEKQRILRERFGIRWRTPDEMNPNVIFD